jgi:hypothetical protein
MLVSFSKYFFFLLLVFFPFVSFGLNSMDTQPWIILLSFFFFKDFFSKKIFNIVLVVSIIFILIQFLYFILFFKIDFFFLSRGIIGYIIFIIVFFYQSKNIGLKFIQNYDVIFKINYIYILVAIIQLFTTPFVTRFLVNVRTSEDRGVTSLTPEPTMFGIVLIFFILIYILLLNESNKRKIYTLILINIFSILFLAKSATASLYLILGFIIWFLINFNSAKFWIYGIIILLGFYWLLTNYLFVYFDEVRLGYIFGNLFNGDFFLLLAKDQSIQDRILASIFPFKASYNNFFMPGGLNLLISLQPIDISLFDIQFKQFHTGPIIMSLWGSLIAELGFVFILLFFVFSYLMFSQYMVLEKQSRNRFLFIYLMIIVLGFTSFTISFPFLSFLIGSLPILKVTHINKG